MYINDLRIRATEIATRVLEAARQRAARVDGLKSSLDTLAVAGKGLRAVARRHGSRFIAENASIVTAARKDVSALAASTFATFAKRTPVVKQRARKTVARKRRVAKAA